MHTARVLKSLGVLSVALLLHATALAQHPAVKLLDASGNSIKNSLDSTHTVTIKNKNGALVTLKKGNPVSFERTCGQCHEETVDEIRMSHHSAVGIHDMGFMAAEDYGDSTGAKDFVTNSVLKMRYFRSKSHYGGW